MTTPSSLMSGGLAYRMGLHIDIRPDGELSIKELQERFGCTRRQAEYALRRLESVGRIKLVARSTTRNSTGQQA